MESFEKAHVVKKGSKTDLTKKRQLRQMLSGYKQNNTDLIKHSEEIDDASSSVSGYSDLNITGSSDTQAENTNQNEMDVDNNSMNSFSNNLINDQLGMRVSPEVLEAVHTDTESDTSIGDNDCVSSMLMRKMHKKQSTLLDDSEVQEIKCNQNSNCKDKDPDTVDGNESPAYVSVSVRDMKEESFNSITGDYTYSTVKNLPWDSINTDTHFQSSESSDDTPVDISDLSIEPHDSSNFVNQNDIFEEVVENVNDSLDSDRESSIESMEAAVHPVTVYYSQNKVILVLRHPTKVYIHGKVEVIGLGGSTEIFGHLLQDKPLKVYAPNYNCAITLKTVENQNVYYGLFRKLSSLGLSVADAEEIVTTIGEFDCVVCLKPLKNSKINFIEENFTATDLFSKLNKNVDRYLTQASQILGCSLYLKKPLKCLEVDSKWLEVLKHGLDGISRGIICGGKGVGKSNFLRYYVNSLLGKGPVVVIDLDPGQAEFTVAGSVSVTVVTEPLVGPAFTHLRKPDFSLNLGMINTMDNPKRYLAAVDTLITYCSNNEQLQNMPWIVNTMGMVNDLGFKFLTYTILRLSPTFLFQIDSNNAKKRFPYHLSSGRVQQMYYDDYQQDYLFSQLSVPQNPTNYKFLFAMSSDTSARPYSLAPKDERYLNFLSYFAELIKVPNNLGLLGIVPYRVSLNAINVVLNVKVVEEVLAKVLNGKVVALCEEKHSVTGKLFTLRDKPIPCHGQGLIRGIDLEKRDMYIITCTPMEYLVKVNTILYADWVPEIRGQEKYLPEGIAVPYRTCTEYQQRQLMFPPRRRFNPLQLLKMSRNP